MEESASQCLLSHLWMTLDKVFVQAILRTKEQHAQYLPIRVMSMAASIPSITKVLSFL